MADIQLMLEAERRGILPPDKQQLLDEARRRGMVPGRPSQEGGFLQGMADVTAGMASDLAAAQQGTTPVVRDMQGNFIRPLAPADDQALFEETGRLRSERTQVVLRDPKDGQMKVFMRTPETDETRLESLGRVVGFGALAPQTGAIRAAPSAITQRARQFQGAGVDPSLATVTQSGGLARAERGLGGSVFGGGQIERAAQRAAQQTGAEAERIAAAMGQATTRRRAGEALRAAGMRFVERTDKAAEKLYGRLNTFIGPRERFSASNVRNAFANPIRQFDNPALAEQFLDPRLEKWANAVEAGGGKLSYRDMRQFRTEVGKLLRRPELTPDENRAQIEAIYAALSQDMRAAAASKGRQALDTFELANDFWLDRQNRIKETFKGILGPDVSDEAAFRLFESLSKERGAKASLQRLRDLRTSVSSDEWGEVVSMVLREMGRPAGAAGGDMPTFVPATFLRRWNDISDEAKSVLFSKQIGNHQLRQGLDRLADITGLQQNVNRFENFSRTGLPATVGSAATLGGLGGLANVMAGGSFSEGALALGALSFMTGAAAARLMTNPRFVNWFAGASRIATPQQWGRSLQSLSALQRGDDQLAQDVREFRGFAQTLLRTQGPSGRARLRRSDISPPPRIPETIQPPAPRAQPSGERSALLDLAARQRLVGRGGPLTAPVLGALRTSR